MFSAPCPYSPLASYDWAYTSLYEAPPGCSDVPWNPVVYFFLAVFQGCSLFMGVELLIQLFIMFRKRKTLYFW
jgi:hypothetical protein